MRGFTLIELLIVIAIIGVLVGVAMDNLPQGMLFDNEHEPVEQRIEYAPKENTDRIIVH